MGRFPPARHTPAGPRKANTRTPRGNQRHETRKRGAAPGALPDFAPAASGVRCGVAKRIGELLVEAGVLSQSQLEQALFAQRKDGRKLGQLLIELGLVSEMHLTQTLSRQLSVPWVSLYHVDFSRALLNLVSRELAERYCLVPIFLRRLRKQLETLYVAMDDPTSEGAIEEIARATGLTVKPMIACPSDIRAAIRVYYLGENASGTGPSVSAPLALAPPLSAAAPSPPPARAAAPPLPERARGRPEAPPFEETAGRGGRGGEGAPGAPGDDKEVVPLRRARPKMILADPAGRHDHLVAGTGPQAPVEAGRRFARGRGAERSAHSARFSSARSVRSPTE